jgi:hypothetical protein
MGSLGIGMGYPMGSAWDIPRDPPWDPRLKSFKSRDQVKIGVRPLEIHYQLTGDTAQLDQHVHHEVQLTGTQASASTSPSVQGNSGTSPAPSGQTGASGQASFSMSKVKHISETCSNAGSARWSR